MKKVLIIVRTIIAMIFLLIMMLLVKTYLYGFENEKSYLDGRGTKNEPYIISSPEDLVWLRDSVNSGIKFESVYFLQVCDIDLKGISWEPIGLYGTNNYFCGVYDGGGNKILNIYIPSELNVTCAGLFGQLGGQVIDLGIESGHIEGDFAGSIASSGIGERASIINCYNKATIIGNKRAGGICDNFSDGSIINCANLGEIQSPISGGIVSYNVKNLINVYSRNDMFNSFFTGSYTQLNNDVTYEDYMTFLNDGIQFINEYEMFEYGYLKRWDE